MATRTGVEPGALLMNWKSLKSLESYFAPEIGAILAQCYLNQMEPGLIERLKYNLDCYFRNKLQQNNFICIYEDILYEVFHSEHTINIKAKNLTTMCLFLDEEPTFYPMDEPEIFNGLKFKIIYKKTEYGEHFNVYPRPIKGV